MCGLHAYLYFLDVYQNFIPALFILLCQIQHLTIQYPYFTIPDHIPLEKKARKLRVHLVTYRVV